MQLKSISLKKDGHYVAFLESDHSEDVSLTSMSLEELHTMIHECVTDPQLRSEAEEICDDFLESLVENAVFNLNTLSAKFGTYAV